MSATITLVDVCIFHHLMPTFLSNHVFYYEDLRE